MSKDLYWAKIPIEPSEHSLYSLKNILAKRLWDAEDIYSAEGKVRVNSSLIPFLEGIVIGNGAGDPGRDAAKLIEAINQHGEVYLYIHG